MMRKTAACLLIIGFLGAIPLLAQEAKTEDPQTAETPALKSRALFSYNPEGRRDPFKDLLGGRDVKSAAGEPQVSLDDLILFGIIKNKTGYTAIVGTNQGFPLYVKVGDKFSDGYVLAINETQAIFRKTHERGIPLIRARDIIKEITEER